MGPRLADQLPELFAELCLLATRAGALRSAGQFLDGLRGLRPHHPSTFQLAGNMAFASESYQEAEQHYRQSLGLHPNDATTRAFLAEALIAQRRWDEASEELEQLLRRRDVEESTQRFVQSLKQGLDQGLFQRSK